MYRMYSAHIEIPAPHIILRNFPKINTEHHGFQSMVINDKLWRICLICIFTDHGDKTICNKTQ